MIFYTMCDEKSRYVKRRAYRCATVHLHTSTPPKPLKPIKPIAPNADPTLRMFEVFLMSSIDTFPENDTFKPELLETVLVAGTVEGTVEGTVTFLVAGSSLIRLLSIVKRYSITPPGFVQ